MQVERTEIPGVLLITPKRYSDHRGFFSETFNQRLFQAAELNLSFVQDNQSLSVDRGVLRGLHYQLEPKAQDKLVRVIHGAILDIAVDIRPNSPTFGKHVSAVISQENWQQILVPKGFAHGFVTLEPNTEVVYKVTDYYSPEHERGILWDDPDLGIDWGITPSQVILSDRDRVHPRFKEADLG
jgi:dTDP-4-dehydrorhamnose 3,5-epimerase